MDSYDSLVQTNKRQSCDFLSRLLLYTTSYSVGRDTSKNYLTYNTIPDIISP